MGRDTSRERVTLIDALDKVLEKGALIQGEVAIRVADVDLIYLGLRIVATSISKAEEMSGKNFSDKKESRPKGNLSISPDWRRKSRERKQKFRGSLM